MDIQGESKQPLVGYGMTAGGKRPLDTLENEEIVTKKLRVDGPLNVGDWQITDGGDLVIEKNQLKFLMGEHVASSTNSFCIFQAANILSGPGIRTFRARGNLSAPSAVKNGDIIDARRIYPHNGLDYQSGGSFRFLASQNHSAGNEGSYMDMEMTPNGSASVDTYFEFRPEALHVGRNGIGYTVPTTRGTDRQILESDAAGGASWTSDPQFRNIVIADGGQQTLGTTASIAQPKCYNILLESGSAILYSQLCKIDGTGRVVPVLAADPVTVASIGFCMDAAVGAGETIRVCNGGVFRAIVENGLTINPGETLVRSAADDGRVATDIVGVTPGLVGVALTAGTGDVGGTVTVQGLFIRNDTN